MSIETSYPYLRLAQERGLAYGDVLMASDFLSCKLRPLSGERAFNFKVFHRLTDADQHAIISLMHKLAEKGWW